MVRRSLLRTAIDIAADGAKRDKESRNDYDLSTCTKALPIPQRGRISSARRESPTAVSVARHCFFVRTMTMGGRKVRLDIGSVDFDSLETDEDFRREARRILPVAIVQLGEAVGEEAWEALQKSLRRSGFKPTTSSSEKRKFIREAGQNYNREISEAEKRELEDEVIRQLREQKASAK